MSPSDRPDLSVIICTRNRAETLQAVLAHIATLQAGAPITSELIVVDNGSTDATKDVVAAAKGPVRYIEEPRAGHSIALNTGVRHAQADLVAFTDDDAFIEDGWFLAISTALMGGTADWVFGPVYPVWPGDVPDWYGPETQALFAALDYGTTPFRAHATHQHFAGVNHAGRKALLTALGGYREDLGAQGGVILGIGNDEDLFRRLVAGGWHVRYEPSMRVGHCVSEARCQRSYHRRAVSVSARGFASYLYRERPFGDPAVPRWMLRKPADHLFKWIRARLAGNNSAAFYHEIQLRRFITIVRYIRTAPRT